MGEEQFICGACGSPRVGPLARGNDRVVCRDCNSISFRQLPSIAELDDRYASAWREGRSSATGATDEEIAEQIAAIAGPLRPEMRCLDWGAGQGALARVLANLGCGVCAFEPHGPPKEIAGVKWCSDIDELAGKFDVIFMVEVIEHLVDPEGDLAMAKTLLADDGELIITTPNAQGMNARLGRGRWREVQNPVHLTLFSADGLQACAEAAGLQARRRHTDFLDFGHAGIRRLGARGLSRLRLDGSLRMVLVR
tara:strand:- start:6231 stop:6986 length:756 start_codon:yes stop_codon:yes gene_type:complete